VFVLQAAVFDEIELRAGGADECVVRNTGHTFQVRKPLAEMRSQLSNPPKLGQQLISHQQIVP